MLLDLFLIQVLNGVQFGVLLFLVAAGLTLIFGIMDFINIAHGVVYMVGGYLAVLFVGQTDSFVLGLLMAMLGTLLLGVVLEFLLFRHLYDRSHLDQVLATFGLVLVLTEVIHIIWGSSPLTVAIPEMLSGSLPLVGALNYPVYRLVIIGAGLLVAVGLAYVISYTRIGMLLRAGASDRPMVSALGVDITRLLGLVFAVGAMLAGFAGALVAPVLSVDLSMGESVIILTFVVIVIGGIGSIRGAFVAAILVGLVDSIGRTFVPILLGTVFDPSTASQVGRTSAPMLIYFLMALILIVRPTGLFGRKEA